MNFRTEYNTPESKIKLDYHSKACFIGSCFSVNIHNKLSELKFNSISNPFGIVYNPLSISNQLQNIFSGKKYTQEDLEYANERWFSYDHHSDFSEPDLTESLEKINKGIAKFRMVYQKSQFLFVTFGTSWSYRLKSENKIVSNCHKQPAKIFKKELIPVDEMVKQFSNSLSLIQKLNPDLKVVFSVSPIRHLSDGFFENQLSKGRLFDVIHQLINTHNNCSYFGAYEMLVDDLRDYRFYEADLVHPSKLAIDYIWEKFVTGYISTSSQQEMKQVEKLIQAFNHKPFNIKSVAHQKFLKSTISKMEQLNHLDFSGEINELKTQLI